MSPQILDPDLIVSRAEIETANHRLDLNRAERTFSKGGFCFPFGKQLPAEASVRFVKWLVACTLLYHCQAY
ncbi:hypothetical protein E4U54_007925 [Claviceps lovelessii]|nr:hypothetical protein E4U54_007925 [Claviceps lovelessii]